MAKKDSNYYYKYYIDEKDLKISMDDYIKEISNVNARYKKYIDPNLKEDIIDYEIENNQNKHIIILKLRKPIGPWREHYLFELLMDKYIEKWIDMEVLL